MGCFAEWDYAPVGTQAFEDAKAKITPKWERFRHAIDFYYRVEHVDLPKPSEFRMVVPERGGAWAGGPSGTDSPSLDERIFGSDSRRRSLHKKLIHRIALHLACDGAAAEDAYHVVTWLRYESEATQNPSFVGYWHIVAWIEVGLRTGMLLGPERPKPWRAPTNVPDAARRAEKWFKTHQSGRWGETG